MLQLWVPSQLALYQQHQQCSLFTSSIPPPLDFALGQFNKHELVSDVCKLRGTPAISSSFCKKLREGGF